MKRSALIALFLALPLSGFADTSRYIVVTRHPVVSAIRPLPNESFEPRVTQGVRTFKSINGFAADLDDNDLAILKRSPSVEYIEPVVERHAFADAVITGQQVIPYGISMVKAPAVWPVTEGKPLNSGTPIRVAVIDTGVRYGETELQGAYKGGHNFVANNDDPLDDAGHGTHVSGIIAAADNQEGVVGVAPAIELYALKVLNQCGTGTSESIISAIDWIVAKKAQIGGNWVANLSLGSDSSSLAEESAFQRGYDAGILFVVAAGNGYDTNPVDGLAYPAAYPTVLSVGAIDSTSTVASFSQRGPDLKVVAPGVDVLSTFVDVHEVDGVSGAGSSIDGYRINGYDTASNPLTCSNAPTVGGALASCGIGNVSDFSNVAGKVALIQRGGTSNLTGTTLTFAEKAKNAKAAGAVGVIVYNNRATENASESTGWAMTNLRRGSDVPPTVVGVTQAEGQRLLSAIGANVTVGFTRINSLEGYTLLSGTSMASPHAAAVAALAWSVAPTATASQVNDAVVNTATDLGAPGVDNIYGHGLVNAVDAAKQLNPAAFSSGGTPPPTPKSGRVPGRRGR
jgi:serine protease